MSSTIEKSEVGELRPSQLLLTFGVGSIVDLPNMSVMVMGLEDWPIRHATEIGEERLLKSVQDSLGPQVQKLMTPPRGEENSSSAANWFDESHQIGVPVAPFPRWMVCPRCRLLAPVSSGLFEPKVMAYRPDKACYVHDCSTQAKAATVVPARFLTACPQGHLDDFPWLDFVHRGEQGLQWAATDVRVGRVGRSRRCGSEVRQTCGDVRRMAEAFGQDNQANLPACRGRHPHLRVYDSAGCKEEHMTAILQGASNSWFPIMLSALSVPQATDKLGQLVSENWVTLDKVTSLDRLQLLREIGQLKEFAKFTDNEVWQAIQKQRSGGEARNKRRPT